jgi:hypothetical protein
MGPYGEHGDAEYPASRDLAPLPGCRESNATDAIMRPATWAT